tara:strand:+ start:40624 stop:41730 length:1107 start_codon:yes stop_codon:yes gene_type:complete
MVADNIVRIFDKDKAGNMSGILMAYGIGTRNISVLEGSSFDIYDIKLNRGVRVSKIERVLVDIGMELGSYSIPVGVPAVRDGVYRLYIQNKDIPSESISTILELVGDGSYNNMSSPMPIGVDMYNDIFLADLSKIPNLLIGGIPGSGKSMVLHSIILSLIAKSSTDIYLVDPKRVEFSVYDGLSSVKNISYSACETKSIVENLIGVMNRRFEVLRKNKCRDFSDFNKLKGGIRMRPAAIIIDEWADIYFQDKKIQNVICALAQKGRAAGISVVIATQRPSADVISGLVKASFSGRMCLKTSSAIDSRIVIDSGCAERITDVGVGYYRDQNILDPKVFRSFYIDSIEAEIKKISPRRNSVLSLLSKSRW